MTIATTTCLPRLFHLLCSLATGTCLGTAASGILQELLSVSSDAVRAPGLGGRTRWEEPLSEQVSSTPVSLLLLLLLLVLLLFFHCAVTELGIYFQTGRDGFGLLSFFLNQ